MKSKRKLNLVQQGVLDFCKRVSRRGKCRLGLTRNEFEAAQQLDAKGLIHLNRVVKHRRLTGMIYPYTATVTLVGEVS